MDGWGQNAPDRMKCSGIHRCLSEGGLSRSATLGENATPQQPYLERGLDWEEVVQPWPRELYSSFDFMLPLNIKAGMIYARGGVFC